ncbi:hypothetical protein CKAH01_18430 [Colletotrichum kahawae]|uniref:Cyanovirin-N domain-containing protein n=1 Tax=Colletotrichum kahawae TaxID=34407 RepID=A0AAD9Y8L2_COLKA|nr:hypothetical protein CKAH01_18430 [Colletotrichum kahawae]
MPFSVAKSLGYLAVLCSIPGGVSGEERADQLAKRESPLKPRGFLSSCVDWGTVFNEKNKMAAHCRTTTGNWTWSVLNLNHCLLNNNGYLMAQDETSWANYQCSTEVDEESGRHVGHGIDLNEVVGNDNGNLFCGRHAYKGSVLSQHQVGWSGFDIVISQD